MLKKSLLAAVAVVCISSPALADSKPWVFSWWPWHHSHTDFTKPYLTNGVDEHERQWDSKKWNPDVWIQQEKGANNLIQGFYDAGIIEDQKFHDDIPYLYVGPNFYKLGGYDQRRVVQSIDEAYSITNLETDDLFYIYDDYENEIIGIYTKHGVQFH